MLAVIIPTLNATQDLALCLPQLEGERIIVADGGSHDETLKTALKGGAVLAMGQRGRGSQISCGAKLALMTDADWLLVLHSDVRLPDNWRDIVAKHRRNHPQKVGYFRYAVQASGFMPHLQSCLVALRCWAWKMPYGDQGLLIPRSLYTSVGGYGDMPLFEDVDIMNRLKARFGRGAIRPLSGKIYTDVSAYERQGWWKRGARNFKLFRAYQKGASVESLKALYYADMKTEPEHD